MNGNVDNQPVRAHANGPVGDSDAVLAALDLGTNNCRLLVARPRGDTFRVVDAFSRIVRLGEGVDASGALSEAAMDRTIEALRICAGKMRRQRVTHALRRGFFQPYPRLVSVALAGAPCQARKIAFTTALAMTAGSTPGRCRNGLR